MKVTFVQVGAVIVIICLSSLVCIALGNAIHRTRTPAHGPPKQEEIIELTPSFEVDDSGVEFVGRVDVEWVAAYSPTSDDRYMRTSLGQSTVGNGEAVAIQELRKEGETVSVKAVVSWDSAWLRPAMVTLTLEIKVGDKPVEDNLVGICEPGNILKVASVIGRYGSRHKEYLGVRFDGFDGDKAIITTSLIR